MGGKYSIHGGDKKNNLVENVQGKKPLADLSADGRIILIWNCEKLDVKR
jgi:hypothetical protein